MTDIIQSTGNRTDIVYRLRLAFGLIVLLLFVAALVGGRQLLRLQSSQQYAIEYSVPALARSQELESTLATITDLSARLATEKSEDNVLKLRSALTHHKSQFHAHYYSPVALSGASLLRDKLLEQYSEQLETAVPEIVQLKLQLLKLNNSILDKLSDVSELRQSYIDLIEPLTIDLALSLDGTFNDMVSGTDPISMSLIEYLRGQVDDQYKFVELSQRMSALLDTVEQLSSQVTAESRKDIAARLNFNFRSITQLLADFDDLHSRSRLAALVKKLRKHVVDDGGLLHDISRYEAYELKFNAAHITLLTLVNAISNQIDIVVSETKSDIELTISAFNRTLEKTVIFLVSIGAVVLLLIALINYYIVERQINRRMFKLTSAVIDIANGNTNRRVGIYGQDELGAMANALEVFRNNARELERSNQELEQFAYAASHDLKSPLRAIENLAEWTLEDAGEELSSKSKCNLEQLLSRAQRLSRLQSDLLEYSRAGKIDSNIAQLNISAIVEEISDLIDPENRFEFEVDNQATHHTVRITPLRQILINLITNCIKHHDKCTGIIEIAAYVDRGRLRISVSDDGPGIAKQYHSKVFSLFETLESQDLVEGSGLGLSLVKKLIEQSNGTIVVVSDPDRGRGCKFEFDWPIIEDTFVLKKAVGF